MTILENAYLNKCIVTKKRNSTGIFLKMESENTNLKLGINFFYKLK
jgi:hypothetical protein